MGPAAPRLSGMPAHGRERPDHGSRLMSAHFGRSVVRLDISVRLRHLQDQIVEPPERCYNHPFRECVTRLDEKLVDECDVKPHPPKLSHNISSGRFGERSGINRRSSPRRHGQRLIHPRHPRRGCGCGVAGAWFRTRSAVAGSLRTARDDYVGHAALQGSDGLGLSVTLKKLTRRWMEAGLIKSHSRASGLHLADRAASNPEPPKDLQVVGL